RAAHRIAPAADRGGRPARRDVGLAGGRRAQHRRGAAVRGHRGLVRRDRRTPASHRQQRPGTRGPARSGAAARGGAVAPTGWHLRAGSLVVAWLVALLLVALNHRFVPASRWLMVHLLLLGAVTNAILIWSAHFAAALLRLPEPATRRAEGSRLLALNLGAV